MAPPRPPRSAAAASSPARPSPLADVLASTNSLLRTCYDALAPDTTVGAPHGPAPSTAPPSPPDPLAALRDISALVRAHATKLGLLLLNKPFTPSAVERELAGIALKCLPATLTAMSPLEPGGGLPWGACVERGCKDAARSILAAVAELTGDVERVMTDGKSGSLKAARQALKRADGSSGSTLASVGQVWAACDAAAALAALGPAGIVCRAAEAHRALLRDAIEELKEFAVEEDEGYDDDAASDADGDVQLGSGGVPSDRPELREQIERAVKRLGLLEVACRAVAKRQLATFPFAERENAQKGVGRLDGVMVLLGRLPGEVDELAGRFYDLDGQAAEKQLRKCCETMVSAVEIVKEEWVGDGRSAADDSFAEWSEKWKESIEG